jgi:hypothetical protein
MNERLVHAEEALLELLQREPGGVTMDEIISRLASQFTESELRAAIWTLKARGVVDFDEGRLHRHAVAA